YIIYLGITLVLLFTSAILGFVFGERLQRNSNDIMTESLKAYDLQASNTSTVKYGWDYIQKTLHCCGVISYDDWRAYNEDFKGNQKIPHSCCIVDYYSKTNVLVNYNIFGGMMPPSN
ncbi:Tetraspanin-6, partial [Armadillidium nasatum]